MRMLRTALALALLSIGMVGCTSAPPPPEPTPTSTPAASPDAIGLIGLWRVSGAEGESPDTWLRLDTDDAQVLRECGATHYLWDARDGTFVAGFGFLIGECEPHSDPTIPAWLGETSSYEQDGDGWMLLNDEGTTLASLVADGTAPPRPEGDEFGTAPTVSLSTELHFRESAPLPSPLVSGDISGRWVFEDLTDRPEVYVEFDQNAWTTSDGCNRQSGRWALTGTSLLIIGAGIATQMGCDNVEVAPMVFEAESAGFDGETLVLVDDAGSELGRFVRV